jgi:hypothetical protein
MVGVTGRSWIICGECGCLPMTAGIQSLIEELSCFSQLWGLNSEELHVVDEYYAVQPNTSDDVLSRYASNALSG